MSVRRKIRETAMQVLFAWDAASDDDATTAQQIITDSTLDEESGRLALVMARSTWDQRSIIDPRLERLAPQWPIRRQPGVDRSLLRLAVWEMTNEPTPPKVVIDEAIELAKEFSTENSASFVNGVLDAIKRENDELKAGLTT